MFYNINVMNSKTLGAVWRLGNQVPGDTSNVGLTKICSSLNKTLETGSVSLRTSSVLVNGVARLYKEEATKLYLDCIKLNKEMIRRSNRPPIEIDSDSESTEEDSRRTPPNGNTNCKYSKRKRSNPFPIEEGRNEMSGTNSTEYYLPETNNCNTSKSSSTTKEIGVQTTKSFIWNKRKKYFPNNPNIDETQPFGLMVVFDKSRIPRKIIYSNINDNTLNQIVDNN